MTITAGVSALYLLLMKLLMAGATVMVGLGIGDDQQRWDEEARAVATATASVEADRQLAPARRVDAWRLGVSLGYASERLAVSAFASGEEKAEQRIAVAERLRDAETLARDLGLESMEPLPVRTQSEAFRLAGRIEADETGLAGRVESRLSLRHRHLFLLGMHVGLELGAIGIAPGIVPKPDRAKIGRHATLAGIARELWLPLAEPPSGREPSETLARYRSAIDALDDALVREANGTGDERPTTDQ